MNVQLAGGKRTGHGLARGGLYVCGGTADVDTACRTQTIQIAPAGQESTTAIKVILLAA